MHGWFVVVFLHSVVLCRYRPLWRADHSSKGVLPQRKAGMTDEIYRPLSDLVLYFVCCFEKQNLHVTMFFWAVMSCRLVRRYQRFGETYCFYPQCWSFGIYLWVHTALPPRRTTSLSSSPWEPHRTRFTLSSFKTGISDELLELNWPSPLVNLWIPRHSSMVSSVL
jgi:hypothetical protein